MGRKPKAALPEPVVKRRRRTKAPKAPGAPKRYKSSYLCFSMSKQDEVKAELGTNRVADISKRIGELWKQITPAEKARWDAEAKADRERYEAEVANFNAHPSAHMPPAPNQRFQGAPVMKAQRKRRNKMQKAPGAPKRYKSSYLCFSISKQDEVKAELGTNRVADISKRIGELWKHISPAEKAHWDAEAKADRERYEAEVADFQGPLQVASVQKRRKKDPSAPKRPMSSFLYFSQKYRPIVRAENPDIKHTDVAKKLGEMWKNASEAERNHYIAIEAREREEYKTAIAEWRQTHAKMMASKPKHAPAPPPPVTKKGRTAKSPPKPKKTKAKAAPKKSAAKSAPPATQQFSQAASAQQDYSQASGGYSGSYGGGTGGGGSSGYGSGAGGSGSGGTGGGGSSGLSGSGLGTGSLGASGLGASGLGATSLAASMMGQLSNSQQQQGGFSGYEGYGGESGASQQDQYAQLQNQYQQGGYDSYGGSGMGAGGSSLAASMMGQLSNAQQQGSLSGYGMQGGVGGMYGFSPSQTAAAQQMMGMGSAGMSSSSYNQQLGGYGGFQGQGQQQGGFGGMGGMGY